MDPFWKRRRRKKEKKRNYRINEINDRLIRERIIRDIRALFWTTRKKDYYKPKKVSNSWNNSYIEYDRDADQNRNLSLDECLGEIELYIRNKTIDLQNSDTWEIPLTIAINFISSKDAEKKTCNALKEQQYKMYI